MRGAGFDALVVADDDDAGRKEGGNVRFLSNAAVPWPFGDRFKLIVVVPVEGDVTLIVPSAALFGSLPEMMRERTWIEHVVAPEPVTLLETLSPSSPKPPGAPGLVSETLRSQGLEGSRIGLCGTFPGAEELSALLPAASVDTAIVVDEGGNERDPVEFERCRTKSSWELTRMERAQELVEVGARTFAAALAEGVSYAEALAEVEYRMKIAGAEEVFVPASRGTFPSGSYSFPGWIEGRYANGEMIAFEINARVDGYWAQLPRTWVVGGQPTAHQQRLHEAAVSGFEAMRDRLEVGVTGSELWEAGLAAVQAAGFEPWARYGHGMGLTQIEWFSVLQGDSSRVQEGQSIVLHATAFDKSSGQEAMVGEQLVMRDGAARLLSQTGSPIGLGLAPK
jgi:Xaa-Pro aminopeptidase